MKQILRHWKAVTLATAASLAFSSCAYDPYYTSSSVSGSYSTGYGDGYGYGGSGFSTSLFVSTGNPQWGYDPSCYSYYDYRRRCYYDPYLNGYYPVGYRPPVVVGCPHPYGWRPGAAYCPPPRSVRYVTVPNYRHRETAYRNSSYGWAKQVRQQPVQGGRVQGVRPATATYGRTNPAARPIGGNYSRQVPNQNSRAQGVRPAVRNQRGGQIPKSYNTPVTAPSARKNQQVQRGSQVRNAPKPSVSRQPAASRASSQPRQKSATPSRPAAARPQAPSRSAPTQRAMPSRPQPSRPNAAPGRAQPNRPAGGGGSRRGNIRGLGQG